MRSYLYVFIIVAVVISFGYLIVGSRDTKKDDSVLVVGTAGGYAPFVSLNEQGDYEGFDVDVAQALVQQMGKTLKIKDLGSMTALFMGLEQGKIDVILWGLSIIPERLKRMTMIPYYGQDVVSYKLAFWQEIPPSVTSIDDLKGKVVCVEVGSSQERILSRYPDVIQKPVEKIIDALMEIQYGKTDAAFIEPAVAKKFQAQLPKIKLLDVPLREEDKEFGVGVAVKKDRSELINQITQSIVELKANGVLSSLEKKWDL